jgi:hypothetical protein
MAYYIQRGTPIRWERREIEELKIEPSETVEWSTEVIEEKEWTRRKLIKVIWRLVDEPSIGYVYYLTHMP